MKIKITELKSLVNKALTKQGYNSEEVKAISDVLLYAQLRGNNQGVVKLIGKGIPKNLEAGEIKIEKETELSAVLNGNYNMGMVVMNRAMDMALTKAKKLGFGIVGTNNTASSTGAIGYYAGKIAEQGFIGFVFAGSPETVATYGSYEPIFGTDPLAIGVPSQGGAIVLDMATAAMAWFGLIEAKTAGKSIPDDVAYDNEGKLTTDPAKAMEGALRVFDRNKKGAGLALMVEILTGPLVGASFTGIGDTKNNWGNLIFVIDPKLLALDLEEFKKNVFDLAQKVKNTKKLPGVEEIYLPGERGNKLAEERLKSDEIGVEDKLLEELQKAAA